MLINQWQLEISSRESHTQWGQFIENVSVNMLRQRRTATCSRKKANFFLRIQELPAIDGKESGLVLL
jgi:hypothetical protein